MTGGSRPAVKGLGQAALKGALGGLAGAVITGRPSAYVPGRTLANLFALPRLMLGALRGSCLSPLRVLGDRD